jgi:hypothetical protein
MAPHPLPIELLTAKKANSISVMSETFGEDEASGLQLVTVSPV